MRMKYISNRTRLGVPRRLTAMPSQTSPRLAKAMNTGTKVYRAAASLYNTLSPSAKAYIRNSAINLAEKVAKGVSPTKGVLPIPGSGVLVGKSMYQTLANKGTGITYTTTNIGVNKPNKRWIRDGQKYIFRRMNGNSCFKIKNNQGGYSNGLKSYNYLNREWIATCVGHYYTGSGSTADKTQDAYLGQTSRTADMYIHSCKSTVRITSATNLNVTLRIYDLTARFDTSNANVTSPQTAFEYGIDAAFGTNSVLTAGEEGVYPSHSKYFRDVWAVNKFTDISLKAGGSHVHTVNRNIHHVFPLWKQALITDQEHIYSGLTGAFLFVLIPTPVHDQSNEDNVGLGTGSVDVVISTTIETYGKTASSTVINTENSEDLVTIAKLMVDNDLKDYTIEN